MATHKTFKFKNEPHKIIERAKVWLKNNKHISRRNPKECDFFEIEVFGINHKKEADELYKVLKDSGYLKDHPLFNIHLEPMQ